MTDDDKQEDFLTEAEQVAVAKIAKELIAEIDKTILKNIGAYFLKVARVVGDVKKSFPDIPEVFISQRIAKLVEEGQIESQGNLRRMRFSEVRLPSGYDPSKSYTYKISLRIRHPSMDPDKITKTLNLIPRRSWQAGLSRTTPKGMPLEGTNPNTYWTSDIAEGQWPDKDLNKAINDLLDKLKSYKDMFQQITDDGGTVEFFVGWYFQGNSGDDFDHVVLGKMSDLKINLSLDIYPPD